MEDTSNYQIELAGQMDEKELTEAGPFQMSLLRQSPEATLFGVRTDQAGLIGLLHYLHGRGLRLLAVSSNG